MKRSHGIRASSLVFLRLLVLGLAFGLVACSAGPTAPSNPSPSAAATPVLTGEVSPTPILTGEVTPTPIPSMEATPTASPIAPTALPTRQVAISPTNAPVPTSGTSLHAFGSGYRIGDVHPFYDSSRSRWMMYFLANIGGKYVPRLLTSSSRLVWKPASLSHTGASPLQTYYVLGVLPFGGAFVSYYGNGGAMEASSSSNLLAWENEPAFRIPNDLKTFSATSRDPYVFFDPDIGRYRCVSSAYRSNASWGYGTGLDVSLALSTSTGSTLDGWQSSQKELIHFPEGDSGEPECPQMMKIGNRWYLFASMARRSVNHVGRLSYWVGDSGKGIDDIDWSSKTERFLDGEDLCAAQLASDGTTVRMWGWIPESYNGGTWGGHLSFARTVTALPDGRLVAASDIALSKVEGETLHSFEGQSIASGGSQLSDVGSKRVSFKLRLSFSGEIQVRVGGIALKLEKSTGTLSIQRVSDGRVFASCQTSASDLNGTIDIRIIAEDNILEAFVADRASLVGRCDVILKNDQSAGIEVLSGTADLESATVHRLKFAEEIK